MIRAIISMTLEWCSISCGLTRANQLKMNPTKSFLGVSRSKFLGFIVTSKGIHLDRNKIKAIQDMNLKELWGLQGRLANIHKFIINLSGHYQSFMRLMKKGVSFVWDDTWQKAFEDIKEYLTKPPVLASPVSGKPFLLCIRVMDHSLVLWSHKRMMKVPNKPSIISTEP